MAKKIENQKHLPILIFFLLFISLLNFTTLLSFLKFFINIRFWSEKTLMATVFIGIFFWQFKNTKWQLKPTYHVRYLLAAMAVIAVAYLSGTDFLFWIGLGLSIYSVLVYFYGFKTANSFIVVLFFLVFLGRINSPTALNIISLYLKAASTKLAALFLNFFQLTAQAKGNYLVTKNFSCTVGEACNGLNNLVSLVYLTLVFCYFQKNSLKKTIVLIGIAGILAVIANSLRIVTIVLIGYCGGSSIINGDSLVHLIIGVIWFVAAVGAILGFNSLLFKNEQ